MKSVLISIQPKWCELIASGKKTIEVRKTRPNLETPFKCYIYCTKSSDYVKCGSVYGDRNGLWKEAGSNKIYAYGLDAGFRAWADGDKVEKLNGKVIGEFVCDKIKGTITDITEHERNTCMTMEQIRDYLGESIGYAWHISDLKIYDKPKKLGEFYTTKKCTSCKDSGYESSACICDENCLVPVQLTRSPQSWCYVEGI